MFRKLPLKKRLAAIRRKVRSLNLEILEDRRTPAALLLLGTEGDDQIRLWADPADTLHYVLNGAETTYANQSQYSLIRLDALAGNDEIGNEAEPLKGPIASLWIVAGPGDDLVAPHGINGDGESLSLTVEGGGGNDLLYGSEFRASVVQGGDGNDIIAGLHGLDILYGDAGMDTLYSNVGGNLLFGGADSDILRTVLNGDILDGGTGDDQMVAPLVRGDIDVLTVQTHALIYYSSVEKQTMAYNSAIDIEGLDFFMQDANQRNVVVRDLSLTSVKEVIVRFVNNAHSTNHGNNQVNVVGTLLDDEIHAEVAFPVGVALPMKGVVMPWGMVGMLTGGVSGDTLKILGEAGNDHITVDPEVMNDPSSGSCRVVIEGGSGNDILVGPGTIKGDEGDDQITLLNVQLDAFPDYRGTALGGTGNDTFFRPVTGNAIIDGGEGSNLILAPIWQERLDYTVDANVAAPFGYRVVTYDRDTRVTTGYEPDEIANVSKLKVLTLQNNWVMLMVGTSAVFPAFSVDARGDQSSPSYVEIRGRTDHADEVMLMPSPTPGQVWGGVQSWDDPTQQSVWSCALELIGVAGIVFHAGGGMAPDSLWMQGTVAAENIDVETLDGNVLNVVMDGLPSVDYSHFGVDADGHPASNVYLDGNGGADSYHILHHQQGAGLKDVFLRDRTKIGSVSPLPKSVVQVGCDNDDQQLVYQPFSTSTGQITFEGSDTVYQFLGLASVRYDGQAGNHQLGIAGSGNFLVRPGTLPDSGTVLIQDRLPLFFQNLGGAGKIIVTSEGVSDSLKVVGSEGADLMVVNPTTIQLSPFFQVDHNLGPGKQMTLEGLGGQDQLEISDAKDGSPTLQLGLISETISGLGPTTSLLGFEQVLLTQDDGDNVRWTVDRFGPTRTIQLVGVEGGATDSLVVKAEDAGQTVTWTPAGPQGLRQVSTSAGPLQLLATSPLGSVTLDTRGTTNTLQLRGTVNDDTVSASGGVLQFNDARLKIPSTSTWWVLRLDMLAGEDALGTNDVPLADLPGDTIVIDLGPGDDFLNAGGLKPEGGLTVYGGEGNDRIYLLGQSDNTAFGGSGSDYIQGNGLLNQLYGESGNDYLFSNFNCGNGMASSLYGGEDDDYLTMNIDGNMDVIDGGDGQQDQLFAYTKLGATVLPNGNRLRIYSTMAGTSSYAGNVEWLQFVVKEPKQKQIEIKDLTGTGVSFVEAVFRDDPYDPQPGPWGGNRLIVQGSVRDDAIGVTALVNNPTFSVAETLVAMPWGYVTLENDRTAANNPDTVQIQAAFGNDLVVVDPAYDNPRVRFVLEGQGGNDELYGSHRADLLDGGDGNDNLYGLGGDDTIICGRGDDNAQGDAGNDLIQGVSGNNYIVGGDGDDQLVGGSGNDRIDGQQGNDSLWGGAGADNLQGGAGNDNLYGEDGDDSLYGGDGNDILAGGNGRDQLDGGTGTNSMDAGDDGIHERMVASGTMTYAYLHRTRRGYEDSIRATRRIQIYPYKSIVVPVPPASLTPSASAASLMVSAKPPVSTNPSVSAVPLASAQASPVVPSSQKVANLDRIFAGLVLPVRKLGGYRASSPLTWTEWIGLLE